MKFLAIIISLFVPILSSAHVKWFVDSENVVTNLHDKVPFYYLTNALKIRTTIVEMRAHITTSTLVR